MNILPHFGLLGRSVPYVFFVVEEPHSETRQASKFGMRTFRKLAVFYYNVFVPKHRAKGKAMTTVSFSTVT